MDPTREIRAAIQRIYDLLEASAATRLRLTALRPRNDDMARDIRTYLAVLAGLEASLLTQLERARATLAAMDTEAEAWLRRQLDGLGTGGETRRTRDRAPDGAS